MLAKRRYRKTAKSSENEGYLRAGLLSDASQAAKAGYVEAMLKLAPRKLSQGLDEKYGWASFQEGMDLYYSAAESGSLEAVLALADIYEHGWQGCRPNHPEGNIFDLDESERLETVISYYQQARGLRYEHSDIRIDRVQKLLDDLANNSDADVDE